MIGEVWWGWTGDGDSACELVHLSSTYSMYTCMYNCELAICEWKEQGLDLQLRNYTLYKLTCQIPLAEIVIITIKNTLNVCKCLSKSSCCLDSKNKQINFYFSHKEHHFLITGRNEVVAKVMFLHVSVILYTGGVSGEPPQDHGDTTPRQGEPPAGRTPPQPGRPPGTKENPPGTRFIPTATTNYTLYKLTCQNPPLDRNSYPHNGIRQTTTLTPRRPPPGNKTAAYGQLAAGTHPTEHFFLILKRQPLLAPALSQSLIGTNRVT